MISLSLKTNELIEADAVLNDYKFIWLIDNWSVLLNRLTKDYHNSVDIL